MIKIEINSNEKNTVPDKSIVWKRWVEPLAARDHPWDAQSFVVVYGFPTTGKSRVVDFLRARGVVVWDTDDFRLEDGTPDLHTILHTLVDDALPAPDVVVTNLTPSSFPFFYDLKFVRLDHEEVAYLSSLRGDEAPISKKKALGWLEALLFDRRMCGFIPLGNGRYILDYLITKVWKDE